jgi:hypothetical protein
MHEYSHLGIAKARLTRHFIKVVTSTHWYVNCRYEDGLCFRDLEIC